MKLTMGMTIIDAVEDALQEIIQMKKKVLIRAVVVADLDRATHRPRDMEDYAKQLERAVKEFHDFILDHRSMDWVSMDVEREYEDQCSFCGSIWEDEPGCCNAAVAECEAAP